MKEKGWQLETSPYHAGEQEIHERMGRKDQQERMARMIHSPFIPDQHRAFYNQLPFLLTGSIDQQGAPWASILFGKPGFIESPDNKTLHINTTPIKGDPLLDNLKANAPMGFLGIELPTRRRNRMNGVLNNSDENSINIKVVQAYGNCPQYIQTRGTEFIRDPHELFTPEIEHFTDLNTKATNVIKKADTFFVASYNNRDDKLTNGGADVNHRGGKPGFVKVENNTLTIPDYIGNFAFNTLGNFGVYPKAGLLFIDFESGDLWQLTGSTEILWEKTAEIEAFKGAERAWRFHLDHGTCLKKASPLRWQFGELSPRSLQTGSWE